MNTFMDPLNNGGKYFTLLCKRDGKGREGEGERKEGGKEGRKARKKEGRSSEVLLTHRCYSENKIRMSTVDPCASLQL